MPTATQGPNDVQMPDPSSGADDNAYGPIANTAVFKINQATPTHIDAFGAAVGDGVTSDKTPATNTISRIRSNQRVGLLQLGPHDYKVDDLAILMPRDANKTMKIQGQGKRATRLHFTTDGSGCVIAGDTAGGTCFNEVAHLALQGPGSGLTYGTSPATRDGIRAQGGMILNDLSIEGFHAGIVDTGDHFVARQVKSNNNYYGTYFAQYGGTRDDILYDNCDLTSNAMASIGIAPGSTNIMAGATFLRGHLGYCPFGVYIEAGDAAFTRKIASTHFRDTSWEALGEAAIFDAAMTSECDFSISGGGPFSVNNSLYGRPSTTAPHFFHIGMIGTNGLAISNGVYMGTIGSATVPSVAFFDFVYLAGPMTWDGSWWDTLALAIVNGKPFVRCPVPTAGVYLTNGSGAAGADYMGMEMVRAHSPSGTITQGNLLEEANNGGFAQVKRNTGTTLPSGVAITGPTVTDELVLVGQHVDRMLVDFTVTGTLATGDVLVPLAGTPYKVTNIPLASLTAAQSAAKVGMANNTTITSGRVSARVRL